MNPWGTKITWALSPQHHSASELTRSGDEPHVLLTHNMFTWYGLGTTVSLRKTGILYVHASMSE